MRVKLVILALEWDYTNSSNPRLPSGETFSDIPSDPNTQNYVHNFTETGTYYFYCGISFPGESHCKDGGVKATIIVVEKDEMHKCFLHPSC